MLVQTFSYDSSWAYIGVKGVIEVENFTEGVSSSEMVTAEKTFYPNVEAITLSFSTVEEGQKCVDNVVFDSWKEARSEE